MHRNPILATKNTAYLFLKKRMRGLEKPSHKISYCRQAGFALPGAPFEARLFPGSTMLEKL